MLPQVKWSRQALQQLESAINYIEQDSVQAAEKVKASIFQKIEALRQHPEKYNPDKFKHNNDGSFRAFEIYKHRITYRFVKNEIRILRIRHTKMNPKEY